MPWEFPVRTAALITAVTSAVSVAITLKPSLRLELTFQEQRQIENFVSGASKNIDRSGVIGDDLVFLVAHVWLVPKLYRRLFTQPVRSALAWLNRVVFRDKLHPYVPPLVPVVIRGVQMIGMSGIDFRHGSGLVGHAMHHGISRAAYGIDYRSQAVRDAIDNSTETEWAVTSHAITTGLSLKEAQGLALKYAQCVVTRIAHPRSNEVLGALTFDLYAGATSDLLLNGGIKDELAACADSISLSIA